jgi:hypothetical protein
MTNVQPNYSVYSLTVSSSALTINQASLYRSSSLSPFNKQFSGYEMNGEKESEERALSSRAALHEPEESTFALIHWLLTFQASRATEDSLFTKHAVMTNK